jgi:hypothetical protein
MSRAPKRHESENPLPGALSAHSGEIELATDDRARKQWTWESQSTFLRCVEVCDRPLHRALHRAADKHAVESSAQTLPRLQLDREVVLESIAGGREATFMACVRQPVLRAGVLHEAVPVERAQRHLEFDVAAE